ncbi:Uncharacterised protein [Mycobacteroides abscessus]|nr:Uncharacterised protein [Mycobacteroides abscessus]
MQGDHERPTAGERGRRRRPVELDRHPAGGALGPRPGGRGRCRDERGEHDRERRAEGERDGAPAGAGALSEGVPDHLNLHVEVGSPSALRAVARTVARRTRASRTLRVT